jgi:hypothetical protein
LLMVSPISSTWAFGPPMNHEKISGAQVFNLCTRTGKIPLPPKIFRNSNRMGKEFLETFLEFG